MNSIGSLFSIGGELYPLIFVGSKGNNMNLFFDETSPNLIQQVEECSKLLKRADYNQIVLAKETITDANSILNIVNWFLEEDIEVIGVFNNFISKEALETLEDELEYGVISPLITQSEMDKKLSYHKKR